MQDWEVQEAQRQELVAALKVRNVGKRNWKRALREV